MLVSRTTIWYANDVISMNYLFKLQFKQFNKAIRNVFVSI